MEATASLSWFVHMGPVEKPMTLEEIRDSYNLNQNAYVKKRYKNKQKDSDHRLKTMEMLKKGSYGKSRISISAKHNEEAKPQPEPQRSRFKVK